MPTFAQDLLLEGLGGDTPDLSGLYSNPSPGAFMSTFFLDTADLWEPIYGHASDDDTYIDHWLIRYQGVSAFFATKLRPEQLATFGAWDGKSPPAVLHLPAGCLAGGDWCVMRRTPGGDYGAAYMACSQPRRITTVGWSEAGEVQLDCLLVPAPPDGVV